MPFRMRLDERGPNGDYLYLNLTCEKATDKRDHKCVSLYAFVGPKSPNSLWIMDDYFLIHPYEKKYAQHNLTSHSYYDNEKISDDCGSLHSHSGPPREKASYWYVEPKRGDGNFEGFQIGQWSGHGYRENMDDWLIEADLIEVPRGKQVQIRDEHSRYVHLRKPTSNGTDWHIEW